jgi:hypothetical protein
LFLKESSLATFTAAAEGKKPFVNLLAHRVHREDDEPPPPCR